MLRSLDDLIGYELRATDGRLGKVNDVLFNDETWDVCYVVARAGSWLTGRNVLIRPDRLGKPDGEAEVLPIAMTVDEIKESPGVFSDPPVAQQAPVELSRYYIWTPFHLPSGLPVVVEESQRTEPAHANPHLRSTREVTGYRVQATDGEIGHVSDFIVDTEAWSVRFMIVDTRNWLPGRKVLIAPQWAEELDWSEFRAVVAMDRETIENSPPYDPSEPVNREYETQLYDHYGRPAG
jgi:hypothetical protein